MTFLAASVVALTCLKPNHSAADEPPAPDAATSRAATPQPPDPASLLLFAVDLDNLTLTDSLEAYGPAADPLIPIGELSRLLQLDVDVLPPDQRITGNLGQSRRALLVDLKAGVARVGAKDIPLKPDAAAVTPTEIYLRASAIEALFPLKLQIQADAAIIKLKTTETVPLQARLQREANRPADGAAAPDQPALTVATPYRLFSPPSADIVLSSGASSTTPHLPLRYDLRLAGDLLFSDFQAYISSDDAGRPSTARFLLERRSLEGDLLGPLHARDISLGDVITPALTLGPRSVTGRGISISTAPVNEASVFNRVDLRGELPPGYDVELYINDVLRGSQTGPGDGRYEFLNVPLTPGVNVIRTVTYGPRGERNEETRVINVGAGLLHRGEATLDLGAVDQDKALLTLQPGASTSLDPGLSQSGGLRAIGVLNYGISNFLTATAGLAVTPADTTAPAADPRRTGSTGVYTLGARTSILGLATQVDVAGDTFGGRAEDISLAGAYKGFSAVLRQAQYQDGFRDENNLGADTSQTIRSRTELTANVNLGLRGRIIPVAMHVIDDRYVGGGSDLDATWRASSSLGNLLYSAGMEYVRTSPRAAAPTENMTGYLAASTYAAFSWQLRAALDYVLLPRFKPETLTLTADHALTADWSLHVVLGQSLERLAGASIAVSGIHHSTAGDLMLSAAYDNGARSWELGAQWSFGIGYDPSAPGYRLTRTGPGSGGSAIVDAFYDQNGDGVREPGEPAAPHVVIQGSGRPVETGPNGEAYVTGLGAGATARLTMNLDKLDDPSVKSPPNVVQFAPRQGGLARINYPLQPTGGVTVMIQLIRDDGKRVGLSSVRVQLVPQRGEPIEQSTEFDGSAIFDQIPLGGYELRLEPAQAKQLRMHLVRKPPPIQIKGDGSIAPTVTAEVVFDHAPDAGATTTATATEPASPTSAGAGAGS